MQNYKCTLPGLRFLQDFDNCCSCQNRRKPVRGMAVDKFLSLGMLTFTKQIV